MFSDTFAGIAPSSAPAFIAAQIIGGVLAVGFVKALYPRITAAEAAEVIVPHAPDEALREAGAWAATMDMHTLEQAAPASGEAI